MTEADRHSTTPRSESLISASTSFSDRLHSAVTRTNSVLVAGLDPRLEDLPGFVTTAALAREGTWEDQIEYGLRVYLDAALGAIEGRVPCIKPNVAFFEQYGIGGLKAFAYCLQRARAMGLITIADAKRGDIGSTAQAYSAAFLGRVNVFGTSRPVFDADALTVSPYLGFDTLEEFINDCVTYQKGLFVLVKTSNPGAADLQNLRVDDSDSATEPALVHERVASFVMAQGSKLLGQHARLTGLGAVVGATYPKEAQRLRTLMPHAWFLIPGYGAQGASASDAVAGFCPPSPSSRLAYGGLVNSSRGIFSVKNLSDLSAAAFQDLIRDRVAAANKELNQARALLKPQTLHPAPNDPSASTP